MTDKKKEQEEEQEEEEEEEEQEEEDVVIEFYNHNKSRICFVVNKLSLETHCNIILLFNCRIISAAAAVTPPSTQAASAGQHVQPQQNNSNQAQWSGFEI